MILTVLVMPLVTVEWLKSINCNAHLIHIDENTFRSNGYPRPHLPLPLSNAEELSYHFTTKELTPSEYMVDLTNDLTFRILHYHSILNRNNFAFSPTAVMSVLVALFEGSAGRSRTELQNILQLPNNHDIIRIGYRDIHRRLRTYFFGSDNPLKGLSLNKENVTITRDYETILMFYGYDLGIDMVSSTMTTPITTTGTMSSTAPPKEAELLTMPTSTSLYLLSALTTTVKTPLATLPSGTNITTGTATTESTSPLQVNVTTEENTNLTNIDKNGMSTTTLTLENTTETSSIKTEAQESTTEIEAITETLTVSSAVETEAKEAAELISSFVAEDNSEPFLRIQKARITRLPSARLQAPITSNVKPQNNYLPVQKKSARLSRRNKRHLFGLKEFDSKLFITLFNSESQVNNPLLSTGPMLTGLPAYFQLSHDYEVDTDPNFIASSHTSSKLKQNYNTDVISHVFYLNSQHIIYTTFKVYNAVLYYKYFDHLRMSALELELDSTEYNLIILLPDYNTELAAAASSLRSAPKLRIMRKQLKPKWVQAIIPDFKLDGTMFLTNDLQNLGICDIFEPNRADFRTMTDEKGIYVKHIEQSINVHIRTNPINHIRLNNGAQAQPIQISVNHPFMFFIIDRDLDVAVMAGRVLNPLNVRIQ
ncbi:hypothetical protein DOY81_006532 [Sarcophaga bullata]|nr:hypothetical protein DOY81_006532 [Sarcophaga bullata]